MAIKGPFKMNISLIEESGILLSCRNRTHFIISLNIFFPMEVKKKTPTKQKTQLVA